VGADAPLPTGSPVPDCSTVPAPDRSVPLHDTPFGMDFEPGSWPAPYGSSLFIAMHGQFETWRGARVVMVVLDAVTGAPRADVPIADFATGWDDGSHAHGRPSDVTFAPDGRLFIANDITGEIVWIAPDSLRVR
jgi:glucose/arabinose dehydrogenase